MQRAPTHKFTQPLNRVVMWDHVNLNTLTLHLQKTHGHQARQGADLQWETHTINATWPFDHVTNVRSRDNLKNLHFHYHKTNGQ